jgi:membrane-associated phospholipid phosphatase
MYDSQCYFAIFLLIVVNYHYYIQNSIEKRFSLEYFGYNNVKRPLSSNYLTSFEDLGMPSGHSEIITIMFLLLYFQKYIPLWLCILIILIVSLQRLITEQHTIVQVITGIICGLIYSFIYKSYNFSLLSFGIVILISLLLIILIYYKVNQNLIN